MSDEATFITYAVIGALSVVTHGIGGLIAWRIVAKKNREQKAAIEVVRQADQARHRAAP